MSLSLSQKVRLNGWQRAIISFGNTDEVFAVAMQAENPLSFSYMLGLISTPYLGWTVGTLLGGTVTSLLPLSLRSALASPFTACSSPSWCRLPRSFDPCWSPACWPWPCPRLFLCALAAGAFLRLDHHPLRPACGRLCRPGAIPCLWRMRWKTRGKGERKYERFERRLHPALHGRDGSGDLPDRCSLVLCRGRIKNRFVRSFLNYVPYAVLSAMTFPAVFSSTGSVLSGNGPAWPARWAMAYFGRSLLAVAAQLRGDGVPG